MMKFAVFFALVAVATARFTPRLNPLSPTGRIVGGVATTIEEVPYQVSLQAIGSHLCGGSIISEQWALTAAHCIGYPSRWYSIRSGSTHSNRGGTTTAVSSIISHPNYGSNSFDVPLNDVALVQLRNALTFGSTQSAISLYNVGQEAVVGALSVITGWGALSEDGSSPTVLQTVSVPIVSKFACDAAYAKWGGLPKGQICASVPEGGRDACQGDSGGPLAIDGVLAGVVSWGNGCARAGFPGVFSEVAAYRDWIKQNSGV